MESKQANFENYRERYDIRQLDKYTYNEKKKALSHFHVNLWKSFTDTCDKDNVETLIKIMSGNSTIAPLLKEQLTNTTTSKPINPFDASSYVPQVVDTVRMNPNYLTFMKFCEEAGEDVQKEVYMNGGSNVPEKDSNPNNIAAIFRLYGAIVSTTGEESKVKAASSKIQYAVDPSLAIAAADTLCIKGKEEDVINIAMKQLLSKPVEVSKTLISNMKEVVMAVVPQDEVTYRVKKDMNTVDRKKKIPILALSGGEEARWQRNYTVFHMPVKVFTNNIDSMETNLSKKGQGKWADDSYLGLPMGAMRPQAFHKITLDDAGVKVGDSMYVHTCDSVMVEFLRSNYGNKIVGNGTSYPMLTEREISGKKFDWVYYPMKLKVSMSGDLYESRKALNNLIESKLKIPCHGKLITYISPLIGIFPDYEDSFCKYITNVKYQTDLTAGESKAIGRGVFPKEDTHHGALTSFDKVNEVWYPPDIADTSKILDNFLLDMVNASKELHHKAYQGRKKLSDADRQLLFADLKATNKVRTYYNSVAHENNKHLKDQINSRFQYPVEQARTTIDSTSWSAIEIPARMSIGSWRGLLLYSEGIPAQKFSDLSGQLLSVMKHAMRCVWRLAPVSSESYSMNKIKSRVNKLELGFFDTFESIYSADLLQQLKVLGRADGIIIEEKERDDEEYVADEGTYEIVDDFSSELQHLMNQGGSVDDVPEKRVPKEKK